MTAPNILESALHKPAPDFFREALLKAMGIFDTPAPPPRPTAGSGAVMSSLGLTPAPTAPPPRSQGMDLSLPDRGQVDFKTLASSPFADTLRAITGAPSVLRSVTDRDAGGAAGRYTGTPGFAPGQAQADTITLYPDALDQNGLVKTPGGYSRAGDHVPEYALSHEFGHRYDAQQIGNALKKGSQTGQWAIDSVRAAGGMPAPDSYGATNKMEHSADAFANAVSYLRATDRNPAGADIREAEASVPGTFAVVQRLLQLPIYARHPLGRQQRMAAQPDATRVRKP